MNLRDGPAKKVVRKIGLAAPVFDVLFSPFTVLSAVWFRIVRYWGVKRMKITREIFLRIGVFPIVNHYYEPLFDYRKIPVDTHPVSFLHFRDDFQLAFLRSLRYGEELIAFPRNSNRTETYRYENGSFESGDAELYYSIIRKIKPAKILEVGSGFSTLMALEAIRRNQSEDPAYRCALTCIEPYEMPFLEKLEVKLIRKKIEDIDPARFADLHENDVLFIDSSHIIRPGGDVLYLILKVLPRLRSGVWVHFHDIFLPGDYPAGWLRDEFRLWNEQNLLDAFLTGHGEFEIVCSLNYLKNKYKEEVSAAFPVLAREPDRQPGSFWIYKK